MTKFPLVSFDRVLIPSIDVVYINPNTSYKIAGVYSFGRGLLNRPPLLGSETTYKVFHRLHKDLIVLSQLKAWEGAIARVTDDFDGWFLSPQFPTFSVISEKLDVNYFEWYSKQPRVWEELKAKSQGMGARRDSVSIKKFLSLEIPLPALEEQRRIVGRIEELAGKIAEARGLREHAIGEIQILIKHTTNVLLDSRDWEEKVLSELLSENSLNGLSTRPSDIPPGIPILRISAATSRADNVIDESDFKYLEVSDSDAKKYQLERGDLLACRYNGNLHFTGKFAIYDAYSQTHHLYPDKLIRFRFDTNKILPKYACIALNSAKCREKIESFCATTAGNIGLSAGKLKTTTLPVPPLPEQHRIVAYLDELQTKVDAMKRMRQEALAELDAMLPAILDRAFKGEL